MSASPEIPSKTALYWPTVEGLRSLEGSGTPQEVGDAVVTYLRLTEEQQAVLHGDGPKTEVHYRVHWALSNLKYMGLTDNKSRGLWSLTPEGRTVDEEKIPEYRAAWRARQRAGRKARAEAAAGADADDEMPEEPTGNDWRQELRQSLLSMAPDAFERLTQRILKAAGFTSTQVLGRSGDGGIDGVGTYRISLISFPVYFQCKRYSGSVRASEVRDFRGAMIGRGDKGLLVTTGTFTADAKREANRDGAPPIDLVDGEALSELLKHYELGVTRELVQVEKITIDPDFFQTM